MTPAAPHFVLISSTEEEHSGAPPAGGRWRFTLANADRDEQLEVTDDETDIHGERLELLAVVRGLEALDQPSRVTLVTDSRYVRRGLRFGLPAWRESNWQWECYGEFVPVKNCDLWQRLERAMQIHEVECHEGNEIPEERAIPVIHRGQRRFRVDPPHRASHPKRLRPARQSLPKRRAAEAG